MTEGLSCFYQIIPNTPNILIIPNNLREVGSRLIPIAYYLLAKSL